MIHIHFCLQATDCGQTSSGKFSFHSMFHSIQLLFIENGVKSYFCDKVSPLPVSKLGITRNISLLSVQ